MGSCFHRALTRWGHLQRGAEPSAYLWRVAVGVVREGLGSENHVHAWLERGPVVISAASGVEWNRDEFYMMVDIEPRTVRLINPLRILRGRDVIDRDAVAALLREWGRPYSVNEVGGVVAI
jgi:hypothetical protein